MTKPQDSPQFQDIAAEPDVPGWFMEEVKLRPAPPRLLPRQRSAPPPRYVPRHMRAQLAAAPKVKRAAVGNPAIFLPMLTLAVCLGGGLGFVSANPEQVWASVFGEAQAPVQRKLTQKEAMAPSASIRLKDAIGQSEGAVPLVLNVSADPGTAYRITGLPTDVKLTAGVEIGLGEWLVKGTDLGKLGVVLPPLQKADFELQVSSQGSKSDMQDSQAQDIRVVVPKPGKKGEDRIEPMLARGNSGVAHDSKTDPEVVITPAAGPRPDPFAPASR